MVGLRKFPNQEINLSEVWNTSGAKQIQNRFGGMYLQTTLPNFHRGEQSEDNFRTQNYETHMETTHHHEKRVTIHKTQGFAVPRYLGQQKYVVEIQIIKLKFTKDRRHKKT